MLAKFKLQSLKHQNPTSPTSVTVPCQIGKAICKGSKVSWCTGHLAGRRLQTLSTMSLLILTVLSF